jgi:hypothetical protein
MHSKVLTLSLSRKVDLKLDNADADECWSAIVNAMRQLPGTEANPESDTDTARPKNFVEQNMLAELTTE